MENIKIPERAPGLHTSSAENLVQQDFASLFQDRDGTYLILHDGHCLCQFQDWPTFFRFLEDMRNANNLDVVYGFVFWSDSRYETVDTVVMDMELSPDMDTPEEGVLFKIQVDVPERLLRGIGKEIKITLKSGKIISGSLESYDNKAKYGSIRPAGSDSIYFNENEIKTVSIPD